MIRIISGTYRGRKLMTPPGADVVRPLPDRLRVSMFNMLTGHLDDQPVFDAFAGVGSFGLEAASRGARPVVMIERDRDVADLLEENVKHIGAEDQVEVVRGDALGRAALSRCPSPVHIAFFDPPYPMIEDPARRVRIFEQFANVIAMLDDEGYALLRTPWPFVERKEIEGAPDGQHTVTPIDLRIPGAKGPETHTYGSTAVHWYMRGPRAASTRSA